MKHESVIDVPSGGQILEWFTTRVVKPLVLVSLVGCTVHSQDLASLYNSVRPAIVEIGSALSGGAGSRYGTGFFVSRDGVILTNYHVIKNARSIVVRDGDGTLWSSVSVGVIDEKRDLAALKIDRRGTPCLQITDGLAATIGSKVVAIGNPLGLEASISDGIISGIREWGEAGKVIQTTAALSHGSSGGALLTVNGEVLGITTFGLVNGQNLNFAVPVHEFMKDVFRHVWSAGPAAMSGRSTGKVEEALLKARAARRSGQTDVAKASLMSVIRKDEGNIEALTMLAEISMEEHDIRAAARHVGKILQAEPLNAYGLYLSGEVAVRQGRGADARQNYMRALEVNPQLAKAHYALALLLWSRDDIAGAQEHVDRLKTLDPGLYQKFVRTH